MAVKGQTAFFHMLGFLPTVQLINNPSLFDVRCGLLANSLYLKVLIGAGVLADGRGGRGGAGGVAQGARHRHQPRAPRQHLRRAAQLRSLHYCEYYEC